jgi:uncharacterized protein DUF6959
MQVKQVEVYSEEPGRVIVRHPDRKFPGILVQGDSLHSLCGAADRACMGARDKLDAEQYRELNELRNALWAYLQHYKVVLGEHDMPLPFSG